MQSVKRTVLAPVSRGSKGNTPVSSKPPSVGAAQRTDLSFDGYTLDNNQSLFERTQTAKDDWRTESREDNVRVVVRIRPMLSMEVERSDKSVLAAHHDEVTLMMNGKSERTKNKQFTYNLVLNPETTQEDVFERAGVKKMIQSVMEGYSATVFAYGQTGTGKTYTIMGDEGSNTSHGLIPRAVQHLFHELADTNRDKTTEYTVRASYLEIYNEQIRDLLNPGSGQLGLRFSKNRGFYVENLYVVECDDIQDMMAVILEGISNRALGAHALNAESSRSHSLLTLHVDSVHTDPFDGHTVTKYGKITFVDLAGSERLNDTKSEGVTLTETGQINKSLFTLGTVISALSDGKKKGQFIPYRDSKLTKLLMDSLGGTSLTLMIACCSPSEAYEEITLSTLTFASRAKFIQNRPIINIDERERLILDLKRQVKQLQMENAYLRTVAQVEGSLADKIGAPPKSAMKTGSGSSLGFGLTTRGNDLLFGPNGAASGGGDMFMLQQRLQELADQSQRSPTELNRLRTQGSRSNADDDGDGSERTRRANLKTAPKTAGSDVPATSHGEILQKLMETQALLQAVMLENQKNTNEMSSLRSRADRFEQQYLATLMENEELQKHRGAAGPGAGHAGRMMMSPYGTPGAGAGHHHPMGMMMGPGMPAPHAQMGAGYMGSPMHPHMGGGMSSNSTSHNSSNNNVMSNLNNNNNNNNNNSNHNDSTTNSPMMMMMMRPPMYPTGLMGSPMAPNGYRMEGPFVHHFAGDHRFDFSSNPLYHVGPGNQLFTKNPGMFGPGTPPRDGNPVPAPLDSKPAPVPVAEVKDRLDAHRPASISITAEATERPLKSPWREEINKSGEEAGRNAALATKLERAKKLKAQRSSSALDTSGISPPAALKSREPSASNLRSGNAASGNSPSPNASSGKTGGRPRENSAPNAGSNTSGRISAPSSPKPGGRMSVPSSPKPAGRNSMADDGAQVSRAAGGYAAAFAAKRAAAEDGNTSTGGSGSGIPRQPSRESLRNPSAAASSGGGDTSVRKKKPASAKPATSSGAVKVNPNVDLQSLFGGTGGSPSK